MTEDKSTPTLLRAMNAPETINIELTSRCPLRCPQCYCDLYRGKDIDPEIALKYIKQAAELKVSDISLSGGETLVYPYLTDLIKGIRDFGLRSSIAISGWGFDEARLEELKKAGLDEVYVSLNGSNQEVNGRSRQGFELAVAALRLLQADGEVDYYINWVARNDNAADFPQLVDLAQSLGVKEIVILESKPDADYTLQAPFSKENFLFLAEYVKNHHQKAISIEIEPCFSPLRAFVKQRFLGNANRGTNKGCGAGRDSMAIDVDGNLLPCRHLLYPESWERIEDYWLHSEILNKLRKFEDNKEEPCLSCRLGNYCISCRSTADKVEKNLYSGNHYCQAKALVK